MDRISSHRLREFSEANKAISEELVAANREILRNFTTSMKQMQREIRDTVMVSFLLLCDITIVTWVELISFAIVE